MSFNPNEWANKLILTIDSSKVDQDLTDFPVLITLSSGTGITDVDATDIFDKLTGTLISGTVFLLHYDGANDSNNFIDSSSGNHSIDLISDPTMSTVEYKFDGSSGYFDGNDGLECAAHTDWAFGTGDFTVEGWIRAITVPACSRLFAMGDVETTQGTWAIGFGTTWGGGTKINLADRDGGINDHLSNAVTINTNTWYHIRVVRDSGTIRFFLDGTACGTSACTHNLNASDKLYTGCRKIPAGMGEFLTGYMDEGRILKGVAVCTSDFTPPDGPYGTSWENRKKIAITTISGTEEIELYTEIERWNTSTIDESAELWTKVPTIVSGTDTVLNFYYDSTQTTNSGFIGDTTETPAQNVWSNGFMGVWHLAQAPGGGAGCLKDSTSNEYHAADIGAGATSVNGKIGKAVELLGTNQRIETTSFTTPTSLFTLEILFNVEDAGGTYEALIGNDDTASERSWQYRVDQTSHLVSFIPFIGGSPVTITSDSTVRTGYHYTAATYNDGVCDLYRDGSIDRATYEGSGSVTAATQGVSIGSRGPGESNEALDGIVDETRLSNVERSAAWVKATYYSYWNSLITFSEYAVVFTFSDPIPAHLSTVYGVSHTLQLTVTISGEDPTYIYDAKFYDASDDSQIGSTISGTNSGEFVSTVMQTPSGVDYSWYLFATSSGADDTSSTYIFTNKFKCVGTVKEGETALSGIPVKLYKRDTGELIGYTTSTGISGTFEIVTDYNEYHYAVALYASTVSGVDPTETNALIYDWLKP